MRRSAFLSTIGLILVSACGGGGAGEGAIAPTAIGSAIPPSPPVTTSASYSDATQAAKEAFDATLNASLKAAETWLDANADNDGVQTLVPGVQYRVVKAGNATGEPAAQASVAKLHFTASSADGRVFNSSFQRGAPIELPISDMIQGWQEAVNRMSPGDEWVIYLHPSVAYGAEGFGASVPPNAVTVYRIVLIDKF